VRFAAQPDDRGQQWWEDFDALLRHTHMRRHPIGRQLDATQPQPDPARENLTEP